MMGEIFFHLRNKKNIKGIVYIKNKHLSVNHIITMIVHVIKREMR